MITCKYGGVEVSYENGEWSGGDTHVVAFLNAATPGALFDASPLGVPPDMEWEQANAVMESVGGKVVSDPRQSSAPPGTIH